MSEHAFRSRRATTAVASQRRCARRRKEGSPSVNSDARGDGEKVSERRVSREGTFQSPCQ
jgi:hypothetical protein